MGLEKGRTDTERKYVCDIKHCKAHKYSSMAIDAALVELAKEGWYVEPFPTTGVEILCPNHAPTPTPLQAA